MVWLRGGLIKVTTLVPLQFTPATPRSLSHYLSLPRSCLLFRVFGALRTLMCFMLESLRRGANCSEQIRCGVGYGHRSMYHGLFIMLPMFRISSIYILVPGHHLRRPGLALHAHVQVLQSLPLNPPFPWFPAWSSFVMLMDSTLNQGVSSHKKIPKEQSWILRQYYGNNIVLFLFCACNELFFVSIYLLSFPPPPNSPPRLGTPPRHFIRLSVCDRTNHVCRLYQGGPALISIPTSVPYVSHLRVQELD